MSERKEMYTDFGRMMMSGRMRRCLVIAETEKDAAQRLAEAIISEKIYSTEIYQGSQLFKIMVVNPQ